MVLYTLTTRLMYRIKRVNGGNLINFKSYISILIIEYFFLDRDVCSSICLVDYPFAFRTNLIPICLNLYIIKYSSL